MNTTMLNAIDSESLNSVTHEVGLDVKTTLKDMLSLIKIAVFMATFLALHAYFYVL